MQPTAKSYVGADSPPLDAISFLREAMELRRCAAPQLPALLDSVQLLERALEGRDDEAEGMSEEQLRQAPRDGDLRKLLRKSAP